MYTVDFCVFQFEIKTRCSDMFEIQKLGRFTVPWFKTRCKKPKTGLLQDRSLHSQSERSHCAHAREMLIR